MAPLGARARREVRSPGPDGAGAVAWRQTAGAVEVVLVRHRERGRWELPKGKSDPGEDSWSTARRELSEEAGLACHLDVELGGVDFLDRGRWRSVRYWLTEPLLAGVVPRPCPGTEIAEARWFRLAAGAPVPCQPYDALVLAFLAVTLAGRGISVPIPPVHRGPDWQLAPGSNRPSRQLVAVSASGSVVARCGAPHDVDRAWHAAGGRAAAPPSTAPGCPDDTVDGALEEMAHGGFEEMAGGGPEEEVRR
ncbi:MAG: NUDIX domain-containing protein [Acidimicrobiales bacterium]